MFSANQYLQNSRSSFLIRDILGAESALNVNAKYSSLEQTLGGAAGHPYTGAGMSQPQGLTPYQGSLCYPDIRRGGYSIESILENKDSPVSIPIPLPVYIRTRSPPGSDVFGKPKRCRRSRTVFSELQLMGLEKRFETQKYLSTPDRMDLAESLGLTQLQVKTWYQNRRMKWKKQVLQRGATESPTKPKGRPKKDSYEDPSGTDEHENDQSEYAESDSEVSADGSLNLTLSGSSDSRRLYPGHALSLPENIT